MTPLFTKSIFASAALHLTILGSVTGLSILTVDRAPTHTPPPIAMHFVTPKMSQMTAKKRRVPPLKTRAMPPKHLAPTPPLVTKKCPSKSVQHTPVNITTISCEGAYMPQPSYPKYALRKKLMGLVKVHLKLNQQGLVSSVKLVSSSLHKSLDQAALDTLKTWTFPTHIAEKHPSLLAPVRFILTYS